jgi:hypothetical protein
VITGIMLLALYCTEEEIHGQPLMCFNQAYLSAVFGSVSQSMSHDTPSAECASFVSETRVVEAKSC